MRILYRGVSTSLHQKNGGKLLPKSIEAFKYQSHYGEFNYGIGVRYGLSEDNAVIRHQHGQSGFPTSGISTTPHLERAIYYATSGGKEATGYVYKINRTILVSHGIREFIVADFTVEPSIPEDDEVILVAPDFGTLSDAVIIEIISV